MAEQVVSSDTRRALGFVYPEVCKNHLAIADFRAKLLALLPTVSGARRAHKPDQASGREPVAAWRGVSKGFLT